MLVWILAPPIKPARSSSVRKPFDPFEVVALANEALDQVRRAEVRGELDLSIRWDTLKDAQNWTPAQVVAMHWLQRSGLKTARA